MAIKRYVGDKFVGLSSDTKPSDVLDGAVFYEIDSSLTVSENPNLDIYVKRADEWVPLGITALWSLIERLIPLPPDGLSGMAITISGFYTALESGTGTSHNYCTDDRTPTGSVSNFFDGDAGTLSAEIDSLSVGSRILTTADDTGAYGYLNITADEDPYLGQSGKEGFYKQLDANITPTSNMTYASHTMQLKHTVTGNSLLKTFYVDDPGTVTISTVSHSLPGSNTRYVSGVPSLASGESVSFDFTVVNAVRKHYNVTRLAYITSSYTTSLTVAPPVSPPAEGASVAYTSKVVTVSNGVYTENLACTIRGYNSKDAAGTIHTETTSARIDTVSSETARRVSGSGQYPASGYGGVYAYTTSLRTTYTEELQMLNGLYQLPTGNYASNLPTAGPDYSTGMGSSDRWVTFDSVTLANNLAFTITFTGTTGTWSGTATTGIKIYAKVEGVTGWVDCNAAYPGVGVPISDGDPAMVFGSSTPTVKRVTFGTVRTGELYVRIGLPTGSNKKFSGITVTSVT